MYEPALPVPRPGRDREARRDLKMTLLLRLMHTCLSITTSIQARSGPGIASFHSPRRFILCVCISSMQYNCDDVLRQGLSIYCRAPGAQELAIDRMDPNTVELTRRVKRLLDTWHDEARKPGVMPRQILAPTLILTLIRIMVEKLHGRSS